MTLIIRLYNVEK